MSEQRLHDWLSSATAAARQLVVRSSSELNTHSTRLAGQLRSRSAALAAATRRPASGQARLPATSTIAGAGAADWRAQATAHGLVLTWVASALVIRYLLNASQLETTFLFYPIVVALAAWRGGWTSGLVATAGSLLAIRLVGVTSPWVATLFVAESLVLTALVVSWRSRLADRSQTLDEANRRLGELEDADRHARTLQVAVRALEGLAPDCGIVLLDRQGTITEWRAGAELLYGVAAADACGRSVGGLFPDGDQDSRLRELMAAAMAGTRVSRTLWQRRADGSTFEADLELALTVGVGGDGFALVVRDRTPEHERQASAAAALDAQRALRREADVAQQQLAALQSVTDPSLNAWAPSHLVAELLERVRDAVHADGIALVLLRGSAPRVFSTEVGLHPDGLIDREWPDLSGQATARITLVQNDPVRVREQSLLQWPDGTASLIAVPVVHAGEVEGTIEVVDRRGRRSTEWEIALLQVVAARVAGLARDHGYADSAVA